MTSDM